MNTSVTKVLDKIISQDFDNIYKQKPTARASGKTNFRQLHKRAGVYMILERNTRTKAESIVYIGMSTYCLYTTLSRHFQKWQDKDQRNRVSYKRNIIAGSHEYYYTAFITTPLTAKLVEKELILTYAPRDNKEKLSFYEQTPDTEIIRQLKEFLTQQYERRRARVMQIMRNPDKYGRAVKKEAQKEYMKIFKPTTSKTKNKV